MTSSSPVMVGVDIGGTKILAGQISADGSVSREASTPNPGRRVDPALLDRAVLGLIAEVSRDAEVRGVGIAAAGLCERDGRFAFGPHLPWADDPVAQRLGAALGLPVVLDNDGNLAAFGEARVGAGAVARAQGRPADPLLFISVGTGLGGGLVVDGAVFRGHSGLALECGHMQIGAATRECECGLTGCWEQVCSGRQLHRLTDHRWPGDALTQAALSGEPDARAAFDEVGRWLGIGVASLCALFDPALVVIGGGVAESGDLLLGPARTAYADWLFARSHRRAAELVPAQLGARAAMVGAGLWAHQSAGSA